MTRLSSDFTPQESTKKYKNIMQGKRAKVAGANFEQQIEAALEYYWASGQAHIDKNEEPFHVTKNMGNGKFIGYFAKKAQTDYKGVLAGGRCIVFEAKHTDGEKIMQDAVQCHQADYLDSHEEMGAECYVMVSFLYQGVHRVPWSEWKRMKEKYGHKYATPEELKEYKVPFDRGIYMILD